MYIAILGILLFLAGLLFLNGLQRGRLSRILTGLMVAALTILGLSDISSGKVLDWWARIWRQLFGWGGYLISLTLGLLGLRLIWQELSDRVPLGPSTLIGLELLVLIALLVSHAPLVLRQGADEALLAAEQGRAGGLVGWALAMLLIEGGQTFET